VTDDRAAAARERAETIAREADHEACEAVRRIVVKVTPRTADKPPEPGASFSTHRIDARTGMRAAHRLQLAAARQLRDYVRRAREDGMGWQEIGALLELGAVAAERGVPVAGAAFGFAAGQPSGCGQAAAFAWRCRQCGQAINDRPGPRSSCR